MNDDNYRIRPKTSLLSALPKGERPTLLIPVFIAIGILAGRIQSVDFLLFFFFVLALGFVYFHSSLTSKTAYSVAFITGFILIFIHDNPRLAENSVTNLLPERSATVSITVKATETVKPDSIRYLVSVSSIGDKSATGLARWNAYRKTVPERYLPGDRLIITDARLKAPRGYRNIGGWDYEQYLKDRSVEGLLFSTSRSIIKRDGYDFNLRRPLEKIKNRMRKNIEHAGGPIGLAILIGDTGMISLEQRDSFARAGLAHLLAVSGLHVGFVAGAAWFIAYSLFFATIYPFRYRWVAAGLPLTLAAIFALIVVIAYGLLTGPRFPAFRATVMVSVYLLAMIFGRGRDFFGAFATALALILLVAPWAIFETGFQLSFIAVFFIALFMERFINSSEAKAGEENDLEKMEISPLRRQFQRFPVISGYIGVSIAAFIGSGPVAAYHFHMAPNYSVPVNIVLAPLVALSIPWGLVWSTGFSDTASLLTQFSMFTIGYVANKASSMPNAFMTIPAFSPVSLLFFYTTVLPYMVLKPGRNRRVCVAVSFLFLTVSVLAGPIKSGFDNDLTVRFLDVGQGESTLVTWKEGAFIIDGGSRFKTFDVGRSVVAPALFRSGHSTLSAIFATHGDLDHTGGLPGIFNTISTKAIYDNGYETYDKGIKRLRKKGIAEGIYQPLKRGDVIKFPGGVRVEVLNPPGPNESKEYTLNDNNLSLTLKLVFGNTKILLTGDIGSETEKWLLESSLDLTADVLKIAHHGSAHSSEVDFLKATGARTAVISVGYKNRFRQPSKKALVNIKKAGMNVFRTDIDGQVVLRSDGREVRWETCTK